jgi:murein tripeptide amidase MpaA
LLRWWAGCTGRRVAGTTIDSDFHGGAIEVVRIPRRGAVELALRGDSAADVRQWFSFEVRGGGARDLALDVGDASFAGSWDRYQAMMSTDGETWRRAPTTLVDDTTLIIRHEASAPSTHYAYFAPYAETRLARRLRDYAACPFMTVGPIGETVHGTPLPVVRVGDDDRDRTIWIFACQHPGETPAAWAAEGLLARLMDDEDPVVRALLERVNLAIVPFVNLDGARLGNHRTNAAGVDLNRTWDDPDADDAPETRAILDMLEETQVAFVVDLHADESAQFVFASKSEGNPGYDDVISAAEDAFSADLAGLSPDFLDESFYDPDEPGAADLSIAANQLGERYGVPSITLELPMGAAGTEKIRAGWSPERAAAFGADLVEALANAMEAADDD